MRRLRQGLICFILCSTFVAGCGPTRLAVHVVKETAKAIPGVFSQEQEREPVYPTSPAQTGSYKVGKPYQIKGRWYYPQEDPAYDETGLASWYGPNFHGKPTANGAIFDQWAVTAAHKTLPMPTKVRVTNLENGRSLVLTINDRGPFVGNRIIDLSRQSARLLGMEKKGVARVRVQALTARASMSQFITPKPTVSALPKVMARPSGIVAGGSLGAPAGARDASRTFVRSTRSASLSPVNTAPPVRSAPQQSESFDQAVVIQTPVQPTKMYVQAGAFTFEQNAVRLGSVLSRFGNTEISPVQINEQTYYRVRLGPIDTVARIDSLLVQVQESGIENAKVVIE